MSKLKFEREAYTARVTVKDYRTDNGIYTSREFAKELESKGQGITHSGVGGHHHNAVAENGIKHIVRSAWTMMIHAALRWPAEMQKELWPLAMQHAVYLYNHTPKQDSGLSPMELWTKTKSTHSGLQHAHPWGCPAYVLDPRRQDGMKLPKWKPQSRRAQYMGASPLHASTVGLVRNLQTGNISPQFYVVYDDYFKTVHATAEEEPPSWKELVTFQSFCSEYDDEDYVPELGEEWLTQEEKAARQERERAKRVHNKSSPQTQRETNDCSPAPVPAEGPVAPAEPELAAPTPERQPEVQNHEPEPEREPTVRHSNQERRMPITSNLMRSMDTKANNGDSRLLLCGQSEC